MLRKQAGNRRIPGPDRRRVARGGRRGPDRAGRHPKVVIIDRYEAVRSPCARYLRHHNFDVAEASDPDTGLKLMESEAPALIVLDDPEGAGFTQLHEQAATRSIPCISLLSGLSVGSAPSESALVKPFTLEALLDEIRRVLGARMLAESTAAV